MTRDPKESDTVGKPKQGPSLDALLDELGVAALKSIQTPIGIFDTDYRILWMNNLMGYVHRCHPRKVVGKYCHQVLKGCNTKCSQCDMSQVLEQGRTVVQETWVELPTGERRHGEVQTYPLRGPSKEIEAMVVIAFDTTEHVLAEEAAAKEAGGSPLSNRETGVLRLMAEGYTNTQISDLLAISSHTVKSHVDSIFNKLGANDRTHAAVLAVRRHLI